MCKKLIVLVLSLCVISSAGAGTVSFDFENGNDHDFTFLSAFTAWPAADDPNLAGDEEITGAGGAVGLPDFGVAWTVGAPNQFEGQAPAVEEGCHVVNGVLEYGPCNDPFGVFDTDPPSYVNSRGQSGYLNTYNLNQWGDNLHTAINDQIATSPAVLLGEGSVLTVWTQGGGSGTHAPEYDNDPVQLYTDGSSGIAVLSAESDDLYALLATVHTQGQSTLTEYTLDLSAFAGKSVFIEVVDAFAGSWGWLVVDEIRITNAAVLGINWDFENGNDHGFVLSCLNPATPAADNPDIAGDEALTGVVDIDAPVDTGLPNAGLAWTIGEIGEFEGLLPAMKEGCHIEDTPGGVMQYGPCNDPFSAAAGDPPYDFTNNRGQSGYLNTYALSQWGDELHSAENDQIATSPVVALYGDAELTVWAYGNTSADWAGDRRAPELDPDPAAGYASNTGGIAVLSAEDGSLLTGLFMPAEGGDWGGTPGEFTLDLSEFAGQQVIIEVVDAFAGGWGWVAIDEIQIANAALVGPEIPEPVAHYPMDEGSGLVVADVSGNGHDGIILGEPNNCWVEGVFGTALQFGVGVCDGVDCNMWNPSADTNELTVSCWTKFALGGAHTYTGIVANRTGYDHATNHWALECNGTSGEFYFGSRNGSAYGLGTLPEGEWAHLAITFDGETVVAYLDGEEVNSSTSAKFGDDKNSTVRIGASEASGNIFNGAIDDLRIFNAVLTEEQIGAIY